MLNAAKIPCLKKYAKAQNEELMAKLNESTISNRNSTMENDLERSTRTDLPNKNIVNQPLYVGAGIYTQQENIKSNKEFELSSQ